MLSRVEIFDELYIGEVVMKIHVAVLWSEFK